MDTFSDCNCPTPCTLELGSSEIFKRILLEQLKIKFSKQNINVQTFTDPEKQAFYAKMLSDVMVKTFDGQEEQKIFRKALDGMSKN